MSASVIIEAVTVLVPLVEELIQLAESGTPPTDEQKAAARKAVDDINAAIQAA